MKKLQIIYLVLLFSIITGSGALNVVNTTEHPMLGEAVTQGLNLLGLDSIKVTIVETPHNQNEQNYLNKINDDYFLFIDIDQRKSKLLRIVAHELIHIQQYESGKLLDDKSDFVIWDDSKYRLENTPYNLRPWEAEAGRDEYQLKRKIENKLKDHHANIM